MANARVHIALPERDPLGGSNGKTSAAVEEGVGLALVTTRNAVETCNNQNSGDQANTAEDLVYIPVDGDFTATLEVAFDTNGARNGYYQFFGFFASQGEDYQNMAGIRGGDGAMQDFLRVGGNITADTDGVKSSLLRQRNLFPAPGEGRRHLPLLPQRRR